MAAYVEIKAGAVAQEDVAAPPPRHHAPEQVARHLVGREPPLPAKGTGDAVLSLDSEYPPVHTPNLDACTTGVTLGGAGGAARPSPVRRYGRRSPQRTVRSVPTGACSPLPRYATYCHEPFS